VPAAAVLRPFTHAIDATDGDGDPLAFALASAPAGMTIDARTGVIQWTPGAAQTGSQQYTVVVSDGRGGEARQTYNVAVAPNQLPAVAAAAPVAGVALEPLSIPFTATDPDGDALVWSLLDAPPGMSIDAATGTVTWTPRLASLGNLRFTVQADDGRGGIVTQQVGARVSVPAGFPAFIRLAMGSPGYASGKPVRAAWSLGGEVPADAVVQLRLRAPAVTPTDDGSPSQLEWSLGGDGQWSPDRVTTQAPATDGERTFTLPSAATGAWRVEVRLVDKDGRPLDATMQTFLVTDAPALHLELSRTIANTLDIVTARLYQSAGATPRPVRVMAWLVKPDSETVGLPGSNPRSLELRRGDSINAMTTLMNRPFLAGETGAYRVHGRLYDDFDGRLLDEVSAGFSVCDGEATVSGLVRTADGRPLDGSQGPVASVRALDLDDGATTAYSAIAADGAYELIVEPGRYRLLANHVDGGGNRLSAVSDAIEVGCNRGPATVELTLGATP
jgi:hypothetical protein